MSKAKPSTAFPEIVIRPAQAHELQQLSHIWEISYSQKELDEKQLPDMTELNRTYLNDNKNQLKRSWQQNNQFLIASVPPNKVTFTIPDRQLAMAGMCEISQESIKHNKDQYMDALYIERLYTIKTKKCPVGKALMLECLDIANDLDVKAIVLDAAYDESRQWYLDQVGFDAFPSPIYRPDSDRPTNPKSRALVLYRENFNDAKEMLLAPPAKHKAQKNSLQMG